MFYIYICFNISYFYTYFLLLLLIQESQSKDKKRLKTDTNIQKNHILRETKLIPRVVYEIEQFSKEVLLLAKKTGVKCKIIFTETYKLNYL